MATEIKAGMTIGRYRLERCLTRGGAGAVWVAEDSQLARRVAVKLLPRLLVTDDGALRRFERGARALSRLQHPNVVTLFDLGAADPGSGEEVPFLVMEFIEGKGLDTIIEDGPPPIETGVRLMIQVARAMAAAHEAGVVHRDLKPANVVVSGEGHATVLDFGLARLMRREGQAAESTITTPGMVLGSCPYMAPEQALGQPVGNTADIFSFGVVLYEVLSGRRAFQGANPVQVLQSVIRCEYPKLADTAPHVPALLANVVARCMERDATQRYPDARTLVRDLENALDAHHLSPDEKPPSGSAARPVEASAPPAVSEASLPLAQDAEGSRPKPSRGRRLVFIFLTTMLVWLVCETIVVLATPATQPPVNTVDPRAFVDRYRGPITSLIEGRTELFELSPKLGWSYQPWGHKGMYRANGQGIRADRDYAATPEPGVARIATFGDSFMYGADVEVQDTWQSRLESSEIGVEALNFGVSGYGTDQAVLRYIEEGISYSPVVVVLSYISENNLRNLTTFRPFYLPATGLPFAKPRYRLEGERLVLVENPLPTAEHYRNLLSSPAETLARIGQHDAYYQQYESTSVPLLDRSPTFRAARFWLGRLADSLGQGSREIRTIDDWYLPGGANNPLLFRMFDLFCEQAAAHGSRPVVMLFPTHFDYRDVRKGRDLSYVHVAAFLKARGYTSIDVADIFQPHIDGGGSEEDLFAFGAEGGHYSPLGHRLIADAMREDLLAHELGERRTVIANGP